MVIFMMEEEKVNIECEWREVVMYWLVCLNLKLKSKGSEVSEDRKTFMSLKGYCMCVVLYGV